MVARLVGVHTVKAKLASGEEVAYHYAWRGGPRIKAKIGTPAFVQEYARLTRDRPSPVTENTVGWLCGEYQASGAYHKLAPSTRRDYERIIRAIIIEFGGLGLAAVSAKGSRKAFLDWRDTMRDTPRSADLHLVVLARVLSWAKDREDILRNPLEGVDKLHEAGSRKDIIWMPSQLRTMLTEGAPHIANVIRMALWTMQRQADILTMPTIAYDDGRLWIIQGKTRARVRIRPADEILPVLDKAKTAGRQRILVNSFGDNWTGSGFRASLRSEMERLKIKGVTFHDLRGTGISYAYANGADIDQIAEISGHTKAECDKIIRRHYLAGGEVLDAIRAGTNRA